REAKRLDAPLRHGDRFTRNNLIPRAQFDSDFLVYLGRVVNRDMIGESLFHIRTQQQIASGVGVDAGFRFVAENDGETILVRIRAERGNVQHAGKNERRERINYPSALPKPIMSV